MKDLIGVHRPLFNEHFGHHVTHVTVFASIIFLHIKSQVCGGLVSCQAASLLKHVSSQLKIAPYCATLILNHQSRSRIIQVLQNVDDLFDREEFSAAPDVGWPDIFNSGVFVFCPSEETYQGLLQCAVGQGSFDGE